MKITRYRVLPLLLALALPAAEPAAEGFTARELAQGYREGVVLAKPRAGRHAEADAAERREGVRLRRRWDRFDGLRLLELPASETVPA
ncbi:MAG: hypothetical protein FJ381_15385, partial [Verrucomicrobia bacterium]|nr:hypothetical protein [Verrucomicrobiota bacterium]